MNGRTLRETIDSADAARFVGRTSELAAAAAVLDPSSSSRVLYVHGPGGIGKSAYVRAVGRLAAAHGYVVDRYDARVLPANPDHFVGSVLASEAPRRCVLIDEADALGPGLDAVRDRLFDMLPDDARLVLAGRRGPAASWMRDGIDAVLVSLLLRPVTDADALALLAAGGIEGVRAAQLAAWAAGSPLALTVAASSVSAEGIAPGGGDLETRLTRWLVGRPVLDVSRDVLEAAAFARTVDARLLAAALPGRPSREGMRRLAALPVTERVGDAYALHAVLAAAVRDRMSRDEPVRKAALVGRIATHLATRARLGDLGALMHLSQLLESPDLRNAIGNDPSDDYYPDSAKPGELIEFGREQGFDQGSDWAEIVGWVEAARDQCLVMRRTDGSAVMFSSFVLLAQLSARDGSTGAVAASLVDAAERTGVDPHRAYAGIVMFANASADDIAHAARLGAGAFTLQWGAGDMEGMLIHYPAPDRRPPTTTAIAAEVEGTSPRAVALSDFRPGGAIGTVEAMVLAEQGLTAAPPVGGLLADDEDPERIARLVARLDDAFGDGPSDRRLRQAIELVHCGVRTSEAECLTALSVSRRTWFRMLRVARERVLAN